MTSPLCGYRIAVIRTIDHYGLEVPFHPAEAYPEFAGTPNDAVCGFNPVYGAVRRLFAALGLDKGRFGRPDWNPLAGVILPGQAVFIKPNLVLERNGIGRDLCSVVTHASVLRPIVDYVHLALRGRGSVVIGDAPTSEADFEAVAKGNHLRATVDHLGERYRSATFTLRLADLRYAGGVDETHPEDDPLGIEIDLKDASLLEGFTDGEMANLTYLHHDNAFMVKVHKRGTHKYRIARELLRADTVILVPKLKTHYKAGVTLNLKNLVGTVTNKAYVPHFRIGPPSRGGDEYPDRGLLGKAVATLSQAKNDVERRVLYGVARYAGDRIRFTRRVESRYRWIKTPRGCWEGNDTIWRVALDLNRIMLYADRDGVLRDAPCRNVFCVVDGVVGGEKNGPLHGLEKPAGVLIGGGNPYAVDLAATRLMGFDQARIPLLQNARSQRWLFDGGPVTVVSDEPAWNIADLVRDYGSDVPDLGFLEADTWRIRLGGPGRGAMTARKA